jgi:outer membrane murein-binding lipoprotein Lpp
MKKLLAALAASSLLLAGCGLAQKYFTLRLSTFD